MVIKRLILLPLFAALLHTALWTAVAYHLRVRDFESMESCRAVAVSVTQEKRYRIPEVYLGLRLAGLANAPVVEIASGYSREARLAFSLVRPGDYVIAWKKKGSDYASTIFKPQPPSFWQLFGWLSVIVGVSTAFAVYFVQGMKRRPPRISSGTPPSP